MRRLRLDSPAVPLIVGAALRLLHTVFLKDSPVLQRLIIDSAYYNRWATEIAGGDIVGGGVFFMSPLYPYLMGGLYALFGVLPLMVVVFQTLLSCAALWMIWSMARRLGGKTAGLTAVWAGSIFPVWIYFDGVILTASLILFLNTAALWVIFAWIESKKPGLMLLAGGLLGLSALARPGILLFAAILVVWLIFKRERVSALLLLAGTLAAVSPATVRNYSVSGELALTTASGGMNFYVGNSEYSTGLYVEPDFLRSSEPVFEFEDYRNKAEEISWKKLNHTETSRFWYRMGLLYLVNHPGRALELWWNKFFYFWNNLEAPNNVSIYLVKRYSPVVKYLPWGFGLLAALGLTGLIFAGGDDYKLVLWFYLGGLLAVNMIYFSSSEFRFPASAALLIGAGLLIKKISFSMRERRLDWRMAVVGAALLMFTHYRTNLAGVLSNPRTDYFNFGSVCLKEGDLKSAVQYFNESLREDPGFIEGHMGMGTALLELGDYRGAAAEFQAAGYDVTPELLREQMEKEGKR